MAYRSLLPLITDYWYQSPAGCLASRGYRRRAVPGQIEGLSWESGHVLLALRSAKDQAIVLQAPTAIHTFSVQQGGLSVRSWEASNRFELSLSQEQAATLEPILK